jgi:hypothetical protein
MKLLNQISVVIFAATIALISAGCGSQESANHSHESGESPQTHEAETGISFSAKNGLLIAPATAKFIDLKIADVEERTISTTFQFPAQVYHAAGEARPTAPQFTSAPPALATGIISQVDATRLSKGQAVSVQSPNVGVSFPGRIVSLNRNLEKATGQVEVLLAISSAEQPFITGAFITVIVPLDGEKSVVSIPRPALLRTSEGDFVYTLSGAHYVRTQVKLGTSNREFAEVTEGLYAGDRIVVQPVMTLWMAELQSIRGGKSCADGH